MAAGVNFIAAVYVGMVLAAGGEGLSPVKLAAAGGAVLAVVCAYGCARAASTASRRRLTSW
jgi:hypothetical protein